MSECIDHLSRECTACDLQAERDRLKAELGLSVTQNNALYKQVKELTKCVDCSVSEGMIHHEDCHVLKLLNDRDLWKSRHDLVFETGLSWQKKAEKLAEALRKIQKEHCCGDDCSVNRTELAEEALAEFDRLDRLIDEKLDS